ncbi:cellulose-binding protein [Plantactinospora sp. S1510]|uniref:Cellulose-binding protein n=1 Tax=Plantactinospora alkalitolerans TaxID=2789879 RepID=A0ABS0GXM2_9ACTN|nr:cellulose-binding protein [Plantactinospora alkalitolerans]MBF9130948.1 cellulose-binding protein [Plantactinospora alkalitolerans]
MSTPESSRPRLLASAPWIVVLAGVLVMTVLFVITTGYLSADRRSSGAPEPVWPFEPGTTTSPLASAADPAGPSASPGAEDRSTGPDARPSRAAVTPARTRPPRTTAPGARPTSAAPPAAPQAELTGRYRVLADYRDSFVGEVLVRNVSGTAGVWTVELRFPDEVDDLRGFWAEGAPQPTVQRSDGRYVFKGSTLAGGGSVPLRFHFERRGYRETPNSCAVNGRACELG